ncbi:MAG: DUF1829 domain-containing protein [Methanothrix sp.]|nr:DUF1829 domain-containing protein [Methanothrix sp.]
MKRCCSAAQNSSRRRERDRGSGNATFSSKDLLDPEAGLHQPCGSQDGGAKPGKASDSRVIQAAAFVRARAWTPESRAYAVLNDLDRGAPPTVMDALQSYDVQPIPRSKRAAV